MKTSKLIGVGALVLGVGLLSSCKDDHNNPPEVRYSGAKIGFSVTTPPVSRAVEPTNTGSINYFQLYAYASGKPFATDIEVNKVNTDWVPSSTLYWPASPVNFYAVSPKVPADRFTSGSDSYTFTYDNTGADIDLLYSVAADQTQSAPTNPEPVSLNFRHALSLVKVEMASTNSSIKVYVNKVTLKSLATKGDFTFPKETTSQGGTANGSWTNIQPTATDYVLFDKTAADTLLTSNMESFSRTDKGYILPQPLEVTEAGGSVTGNYIEVLCKIMDANGIALWPGNVTPAGNKAQNGYGIIRFPMNCNNLAALTGGQGYIYRITINKAPGLEPIEFDNITVDEYNANDVDTEPDDGTPRPFMTVEFTEPAPLFSVPQKITAYNMCALTADDVLINN